MPRKLRVNREIRISPVRLVDEDDNQIGVVDLHEAFRRAEAANLDLVEVAPQSRPPVCRIMDYGKHRYEESKKEQRARAKSRSAEMKEVRLGRTIKVDQHDVEIRVNRARKFLLAGHKVQISQQFRGREMQHRDLGRDIINGVIEALSDVSKVDGPIRQAGRAMSVIVAPDKDKIRAYERQKQAEEAAKAEAAGEAPQEETTPAEAEKPAAEAPAPPAEAVEEETT
ncbi:MAG: translation initiation factor IF-3 [Phycisphaerales bacterium JB038]